MCHDHTHAVIQGPAQPQGVAEILMTAALGRQFMPAVGQERQIQMT